MTTHRQSACLLACLLLCVGCGKKPALTRPPAYVNETAVPTAGKPWTVPDFGLELVFVEAGSFMMGSEDGEFNETPVHQVRIMRPFWMGKYEATQAQYEALTGSNPSGFQKGRMLREEERDWWLWRKLAGPRQIILTEDTSAFPVEQVSWHDAFAFCVKLTERERRANHLPDGYEYRLPTEAEWEYAARGGTESQGSAYAGSNNVDAAGWHVGNSEGGTHAVGGRKANELGLHDMTGNVWEWCVDWYVSYAGGGISADPSGPTMGRVRVIRGGSWDSDAPRCRVAFRPRSTPTPTFNPLGFRVVLAPVIER